MPFEKETFIKRFVKQANLCVSFAEKYLGKPLPKEIMCNIGGDYLYKTALRKKHIKYIGGRLLKPEQLRNVSVYRAAKLTFADGKTPRWIDLCYEEYDDNYSYIEVNASRRIVGDESKTMRFPEGTRQFHLLGPAEKTFLQSIKKWFRNKF